MIPTCFRNYVCGTYLQDYDTFLGWICAPYSMCLFWVLAGRRAVPCPSGTTATPSRVGGGVGCPATHLDPGERGVRRIRASSETCIVMLRSLPSKVSQDVTANPAPKMLGGRFILDTPTRLLALRYCTSFRVGIWSAKASNRGLISTTYLPSAGRINLSIIFMRGKL